jgi:hypothetical protein
MNSSTGNAAFKVHPYLAADIKKERVVETTRESHEKNSITATVL